MQSVTSVNNTSSSDDMFDYIPPCELPTKWGVFALHAFVERSTGKEHLALSIGNIANGEPVLARLHSECLTGDALFSQRCDCGAQLESALERIAAEGRGIGLVNKIRAYALQDAGADTVVANQQLGFAADLRDYSITRPMLQHLGINSVRLMTNNPRKVNALTSQGIEVTERLSLRVNRNPFNEHYLDTKKDKLGHLFGANGEQDDWV